MRAVDAFWGVAADTALDLPAADGAALVALELDNSALGLADSGTQRVTLPRPRALDGEPLVQARADDGAAVALASRRADGTVALAFDPDAAVARLTQERAMTPGRPLTAKLPFAYNKLPAPVRRLGRDLLTKRRSGGEQQGFPAWPADPSVEAARLVYLRARQAAEPGTQPEPFWPDGKSCALVLTHDVDTAEGLGRAPDLAAELAERGLPSCWFIVAKGYPIDDGVLRALRDAGGEIGLHDAHHDNRLAFLDPSEMAERLDGCRDLIDRHEVRGFRSPSMLRTPELYGVLRERFAYDSSVPDTGLLPSRNGCATVFPLDLHGMPVLPLTVPPDGQLISRGLGPDEVLAAWIEKVEWIRSVGGAAVALAHPEEGFLEVAGMRDAYRRFLDWCAAQDDAWHATPGQVMDHWAARSRAVSAVSR